MNRHRHEIARSCYWPIKRRRFKLSNIINRYWPIKRRRFKLSDIINPTSLITLVTLGGLAVCVGLGALF